MSLIRQLIYGIECPYRNMSTRKQQMEAKKKNPFIFKGHVICADMDPEKNVKVLS